MESSKRWPSRSASSQPVSSRSWRCRLPKVFARCAAADSLCPISDRRPPRRPASGNDHEMSVVRMKQSDGPQSGGGMDREVDSRRLSAKLKIALGAVGVLLLLVLFYCFAPSGQQPDGRGLAAHHLDRQRRAGSTISCRCARGSSRCSPSSRRGRGRPGRARAGRGRRHGHPGPAARGAFQFRSAAERPRPPDRGHPADQLDAQPGARAQPDPARQRARA